MTGRRRVAWCSRSGALMIVAIAASGCVRPGSAVVPVQTRDWSVAVARAQAAAAAGRFAEADSALAARMEQAGASTVGAEAAYWRAVFQLDPANPNGDRGRALEYLARVLTDTGGSYRVAEARVLRGLALGIDSLRRLVTLVRATVDSLRAAPLPAPRPSQREEDLAREVQRLKDQLEKTTAALDLIRRRLTAPGRPGTARPGSPPTRL
jgi:hypothetical protein